MPFRESNAPRRVRTARAAAKPNRRVVIGPRSPRTGRPSEAAGFTPKISFTTDDYLAVQALVAAGLGVTTLPGLALRAARHPGVATAELPGARRHVFAMTYGQAPDAKSTTRLIEMLARVAIQTSEAS
ncbi:MAG: LysR substrate-binding domain-containing protein [Streptosporangiaceae bacterium]